MAGKKSFFPHFKYYIPEDLSKQAYVYWYENGKRIRHYGDINHYPSWHEREKAAIKIIESLRLKYKPEIYTSKNGKSG